MSRTYKNEHKTDGWHVGRRLERRARPAVLEVEDEGVKGFGANLVVRFEPVEPELVNDGCGCYCRRCLLHDDCGGCVEPGGHP